MKAAILKNAKILVGSTSPKDFITANAKDADTVFGVTARGLTSKTQQDKV